MNALHIFHYRAEAASTCLWLNRSYRKCLHCHFIPVLVVLWTEISWWPPAAWTQGWRFIKTVSK